MDIRRARLEDLPSIVEIYNVEVTGSTATFDTESATVDGKRAWFHEHASAPHPILVADVAGEVAGWAALSPWSERPAYARTAELSVYVAGHHRRRGVGKALVAATLDHGRNHGLRVVLARISCGEGPGSRMLHESLGFTLVGTMHRVGHKHGRVLDVDLLECQLSRTTIPGT